MNDCRRGRRCYKGGMGRLPMIQVDHRQDADATLHTNVAKPLG
jgi:hypothetical protein